MSTILGHTIRLIRPDKPKRSIVYKDERPRPKYNKKPITREIGVAEFFKLCLEYKEDC